MQIQEISKWCYCSLTYIFLLLNKIKKHYLIYEIEVVTFMRVYIHAFVHWIQIWTQIRSNVIQTNVCNAMYLIHCYIQ